MDGTCSTKHGKMRNAYTILVGKDEDMGPLEILSRKLRDNTKIDLGEIGCQGVARNRLQLQAIVITVRSSRAPQ